MLFIERSVNDSRETLLEEGKKIGSAPSTIEGEAFESLLRSHRSRIHGICLRYTGNVADSEDLVQEAFLRAYRGLANFRGESRFSTWLYRITVNVCLNWIASRKPRAEANPDGLEIEDPAPNPSERLEDRQTAAAIREAVARLPERQRMTLVLRVYEDLSHREISEIMGGSIGTAKTNLFFALKNLKKLLGGRP
jgi:RNA polymerase sigma-70 factor (ECF subfamily)